MSVGIIILILCLIIVNRMGIIKEFNELPLYVKAIVITLLITMPFWFVILYLYFPALLTNDWYKIVGFCFVPCFVWYCLTLFASFLFSHFMNIDLNEFSRTIIFWAAVGFDTVFYLLVISVLLIVLKIQFEYFLAVIFGYKVIVLFLLKPYTNKLKQIL